MVFGDSTMTYKELIANLIAKRKKFNVDSRTLSHMIGVSDSLVGEWERLKKVPNAINLFAWCNALEIDIQLATSETEIDSNFQPSTEVIAWTKKQGVDHEKERRKFINYYQAKQRTARSWDAMFRLWVERSIEFERNRKANDKATDKYSSDFIQERRNRILDISDVPSGALPKDTKH